MTATATEAVRDAIVKAILDDPVLAMTLKGEQVYLDQPPANSPLPYITIEPAQERPESRYMQPGHRGSHMLGLWGLRKQDAGRIWVLLYPVLHGRRLTVAGHTMRQGGVLQRLTDFSDPDRTAHKIVAEYQPLTREAA